MQRAEVPILPLDHPGRSWLANVEAHLYDVLSVSSMVHWVFQKESIINMTIKSYLEEMRSTETIDILRTVFGVNQKDLCWVKGVAEFALARNTMLKAFGIRLIFLDFSLHLITSTLLLANCFTQKPICLLNLFQLILNFFQFF